MSQIRAFIAVILPPAVRQALGALAARQAAQVPPGSVRWVKPEAMHLTVRFLGDTAVAALPQLEAAMDSAAAAQDLFELHTQGFGCFPHCRRPRVLWAGLAGDLAAMVALKRSLDTRLVPLGWPPEERAFSPHLTLGRVKDGQALQDQRWPENVPELPIAVTGLTLIRSDLRPEGPQYTVLHHSPLRGG